MYLLENSVTSRILLQKRALYFSLFTMVLLFVMQPFGTYDSPISYKYLRLAGYGVITFSALYIAGLIEIQLSKYQNRIKYYPALVIGLYLFITALFNHSYFVVAVLGSWHWQNQVMFIFYVSAIAIFPIIFAFMKNEPFTNKLPTTSTDESIETLPLPVEFIGDNKNDLLRVLVVDIVSVRSADNYCEISICSDGKLITHMLRISLTKALMQIPEDSLIKRCHRSYAVNLSLVEKCTGNANGLELTMLMPDLTVPVSRSYVAEIKQALLLAPNYS
ncbi:MAG: DNA-binding LytR/AlgR family response regulator [Psychrosphaera sp.]|jgi:DNA-binding LytR/AlgR family response regulator